MTNDLQKFNFEGQDLAVKEIKGQVYFNAEQAAFGLGLTKFNSQGKEYIRWERVNEYIGVSTTGHKIKRGDYITEPQFYKLAIKANNPAAEKFQDWVTSEVLPSIRKHGAYMTPDKIDEILSDPDTIIKLATQLKVEREGRLVAEQRVNELTPKASYYDLVLQNKTLVTITQIAKDYGMSGQELNRKLHELGVIYRQGKTWLLYSKYQRTGWTQSETFMAPKPDGTQKAVMHTKWTQKGRLGLYALLKQNGILPLIELEDED